MNETSTTTQTYRDDVHGGRALSALFSGTEAAREAARRLHEEGFHRTWIGITHDASESYDPGSVSSESDTRQSGTLVETDAETVGEKIGRFFSGEGDLRSLQDELVRHGVAPDQARSIENDIPIGSAVLTVDGHNHPEAAAAIVEQSGGHIIAGEYLGSANTAGLAGAGAATAADRRGSDVLGYRDSSRYARGEEIDEQRRLQLREERLQVDKAREAAGEATVGKKVIEKQQDFDVPVVHEELFVERRAPSPATQVSQAAFDESETIRIPLTRERLVVTKRPVVTGEVVVGKRTVTQTEHVAETTREERLRVDPSSTA